MHSSFVCFDLAVAMSGLFDEGSSDCVVEVSQACWRDNQKWFYT